MSTLTDLSTRVLRSSPFRVLPAGRWSEQRATHRDADPAIIAAALERSSRRASGNWYVVCASTALRDAPVGAVIADVDLVAWRDADGLPRIAPAACPHLGADLCTGRVDRGALICPWHGLRLTGRARPGWTPYPSHDDGVLVWVRLDDVGGEEPTLAPVVPDRPSGSQIAAVTRLDGTCEPRDVIANRMDPWHGAWFHPYSFAQLEVLEAPPADGVVTATDDRFLVAVTFHVGRIGMPVVAEFTSPEPRTIVMRIVEGEGRGSVVETHATPLGVDHWGRARTAVIEAVVAHSDRPGFARTLRARPLIAAFMRRAANRLWRDDLVYAERLYALRSAPR